MQTLKRITAALAVPSLFVVVGCGGGGAPAPSCSGASCVCNAGTVCDLTGSICAGQSCSLKCADHTNCTGACGEACSVDCDSQSTCMLTVGEGASVACAGG